MLYLCQPGPRLSKCEFGSEDEVRLMPRSLESKSGMKNRSCYAGDDDHRNLENREWNLFIEQLPIETATEFRDSKSASDEDGENGETETYLYQLFGFMDSGRLRLLFAKQEVLE